MNRRTFLAVALGATTSGCFGREDEPNTGTVTTTEPSHTSSPTPAGDPTPGVVRLTPVADGLQEPVAVEPSPTARDVFFIADRYGWIRRADGDGLQGAPVLNVRDDVTEFESWEQGLVGMTLHPDFERTRKMYVRYSGKTRPDMPDESAHAFVLLEVTLDESFTTVVSEETRTLLEFPSPGVLHNGGGLTFADDGTLFVAVGDGGDQGDEGPGHAEDWYDALPGGNGQDVTENFHGSILRIVPDERTGDRPYGIPDDNPLVGDAGLDEHYAWGFRNPYGISLHDGTLYASDVGEDWYGEVNVVEKGGNYGWNVREGDVCYALEGDPDPGRSCPETTPDGAPLRDPVLTYPHSSDTGPTAIIGGPVYTGDAIPFLRGRYLFGDVLSKGGGELFAATRAENDAGEWPYERLSLRHDDGTKFDDGILGFGQDSRGECYLCTTDFEKEGRGTVYRLAPVYE